jgi:hypothetical protein
VSQLRIKILAPNLRRPLTHIKIIDADTGEELTDVVAFILSMRAESPHIEAVLTRYKTDDSGLFCVDYETRELVSYEQTVEVVEADMQTHEAVG